MNLGVSRECAAIAAAAATAVAKAHLAESALHAILDGAAKTVSVSHRRLARLLESLLARRQSVSWSTRGRRRQALLAADIWSRDYRLARLGHKLPTFLLPRHCSVGRITWLRLRNIAGRPCALVGPAFLCTQTDRRTMRRKLAFVQLRKMHRIYGSARASANSSRASSGRFIAFERSSAAKQTFVELVSSQRLNRAARANILGRGTGLPLVSAFSAPI